MTDYANPGKQPLRATVRKHGKTLVELAEAINIPYIHVVQSNGGFIWPSRRLVNAVLDYFPDCEPTELWTEPVLERHGLLRQAS